MRILRRGSRSIVAMLLIAAPAIADPPTTTRPRERSRPVQLWPPATQPTTPGETTLELDGWLFRASRSADPRDGVPWELTVTPVGENATVYKQGDIPAPGQASQMKRQLTALAREPARAADADAVPVVRIPDAVWKGWMSAELQDVVGIHYHELVTDDQAAILFTIHKVPPDEPDGKPPANYAGKAGSRIEATLMAPLTFHLDQSVAIREDPLRKELADSRAEHELGHAEVSQDVLLAALGGPQDWQPLYCKGQRSRIAYYWKRERIGRSWDGYRKGIGKLLTARTTLVLVPPTRWSLMLPIPPERLTKKHLQSFNDSIVLNAARFGILDDAAQKRFHAAHGAFEPNEEKPPGK